MDECVVTRNATLIVKRTLARAEKMSKGVAAKAPNISADDTQQLQERSPLMNVRSGLAAEFSQASELGQNEEGLANDIEFDWMNTPFPIDDGQQALFWVEWAHYLEDLGV